MTATFLLRFLQLLVPAGTRGLPVPAPLRGGAGVTHVPMQGATPCRLSLCGRVTLEPTTRFYERFQLSNCLDGRTAGASGHGVVCGLGMPYVNSRPRLRMAPATQSPALRYDQSSNARPASPPGAFPARE